MTRLLTRLANEADGRYFNADERRTLQSFADALPRRMRAAEQLEQQEEPVLRAALEGLQQRYPHFEKFHDQAWARQFRDAQLVLRAAATAMILDDVNQLDDRLLYWLRTMFAANNYTPAFVRDTFTEVRDRLQDKLDADDFALMRPYLDRALEVLPDFPEPAMPAV